MGFKNVFLEVEEAEKWANYFIKKYPEGGGFISMWSMWTGMTVNEDKSIFVNTGYVNRENPHDIDLFYFWHGQLFSVKMRQVWGEKGLEAWEFKRLMSYPELNSDYGIHLPEQLEKDKEQILQDFKAALIIYGDDGTKSFNPPLPNIQIRMGGKVY